MFLWDKTTPLLGPVVPDVKNIQASLSLSIYFIGAHIINTANMVDKINIFGDMIVFSSYAIQVLFSLVTFNQ